ncbi:hypothetical protein L2D25_26470 [Salmonella enterica subsp. enterica serovar Muenchen]|uniref:competence protein CoiA family protein n=1 Tax=Salmonella enterica TaxID=28901 RepID=UPI001F0E6976|nr:competence protein CoiA family protein [Salmonella enterica]EAW2474455.1 hypothetical protein [Salmonella enterica subsp. enterica]EEJ6214512.1 hypothetical protein [Salmonella enterica]MCH5444904.1 hypothetical protein [Salmonella enterica subsp. enterica serovar Muenchen]
MRKRRTEGIPFGLERDTGKLLAITDVARGSACGCLCPGCKTPLVARQGEINLWHFAHATDMSGDCDGLMAAIQSMVTTVIRERGELFLPPLPHGSQGGRVTLSHTDTGVPFCGTIAPLLAATEAGRIAIFPDDGRSPSLQTALRDSFPANNTAVLRISLQAVDAEIARVQRGEGAEGYRQCVERLLLDSPRAREWLYHPAQILQQASAPLSPDDVQVDDGPLRARLRRYGMSLPAELPGEHHARLTLRKMAVASLCHLTVRPYEINQTDDFPEMLLYFRRHCLENSDTVNRGSFVCWKTMVTGARDGMTMTERDYLRNMEQTAGFCIRLAGTMSVEIPSGSRIMR